MTVRGRVRSGRDRRCQNMPALCRPTDDDTPTLSQHGRHRDHRHDRSRDDPKLPPRDLLLNFDLVCETLRREEKGIDSRQVPLIVATRDSRLPMYLKSVFT
jgi:hypothetical protein